MYSEIIKNVGITGVVLMKDVTGLDQIIVFLNSYAILQLTPETGTGFIVRSGSNSTTEPPRTYMSYSWKSNCLYFMAYYGYILELNCLTGELKRYDYTNGSTYISPFLSHSFRDFTYVSRPSSDGDIWFGTRGFGRIPGLFKLDVVTKELTNVSFSTDNEMNHRLGAFNLTAVKIDGDFAGVYSEYYFAPDYETALVSTIAAEVASSGLTVTSGYWLHTDDREIASATRRLFVKADGTFKFIDIKSPSTYIDSQYSTGSVLSTGYNNATWVDETATPVDDSAWSAVLTLDSFRVDVPALMTGTFSSEFLDAYIGFGRFVYQGGFGSYYGSAAQLMSYAIDKETGEAIYTDSFDKADGMLFVPNSAKRYFKANFRGDFGFSSSDEYVAFLYNLAGTIGFIRPDNKTFQAYNPTTDPDSYIVAEISIWDHTEEHGLGFYYKDGTTLFTATDGEDWFRSLSNTKVRAAFYGEIITEIDPERPDLASITVKATADWALPEAAHTYNFDKVPTFVGLLNNAIEIGTNLIAVVGKSYSGVAIVELTGLETYDRISYTSRLLSPNGSIFNAATNELLTYGYISGCELLNVTDPANVVRTNIPVQGGMREVMYAKRVGSQWVLTGEGVRLSSYRNIYLYMSYIVGTINTALTLPAALSTANTVSVRSQSLLPQETYSDAECETALTNYMSNYGLARHEAINKFYNTCRFNGRGVESDGSYIYIGLQPKSRSGLRGIRFEETVGSGIWIDENTGLDIYPHIAVIDELDLSVIDDSNVHLLEIQDPDLPTDLGVMGSSDDYVFWLRNEQSSSRVRVTALAKSEIPTGITAGFIGNVLSTTTISTNSTAVQYGWGSGSSWGSQNWQVSNCFQAVGNILYASIISNVSGKPAIYRIDLTTLSVELYATLNSDNPKSLTITGTNMYISSGSTVYRIENYSGVTVPYALV